MLVLALHHTQTQHKRTHPLSESHLSGPALLERFVSSRRCSHRAHHHRSCSCAQRLNGVLLLWVSVCTALAFAPRNQPKVVQDNSRHARYTLDEACPLFASNRHHGKVQQKPYGPASVSHQTETTPWPPLPPPPQPNPYLTCLIPHQGGRDVYSANKIYSNTPACNTPIHR